MNKMTTKTNQLFSGIEYYPTQIDLNRNLYNFYKQLQLHSQDYEKYQNILIDQSIVNRQILADFASSPIFKFRKFPQEILNQQEDVKLNVLNAFKLYLILQENIKRKVIFSDELLASYQKLDNYFSELKEKPEIDLEVVEATHENEAQSGEKVATHKGQIFLVVLMLSCTLGALGLTLFTSGTGSLILQACLYGLSFLLSRGLVKPDQIKDVTDTRKANVFAIKLHHFFEQFMPEVQKINPQ